MIAVSPLRRADDKKTAASAEYVQRTEKRLLNEEIPFMNEDQFRRSKKLVRSLCANLDYGNCLLLDNQFGTCVCPQLISYSLICKYFRTAVLPADWELYVEIMETDTQMRCGDCSQPLTPGSKNTLYCEPCANKRTRRNKREWARKNRGRK